MSEESHQTSANGAPHPPSVGDELSGTNNNNNSTNYEHTLRVNEPTTATLRNDEGDVNGLMVGGGGEAAPPPDAAPPQVDGDAVQVNRSHELAAPALTASALSEHDSSLSNIGRHQLGDDAATGDNAATPIGMDLRDLFGHTFAQQLARDDRTGATADVEPVDPLFSHPPPILADVFDISVDSARGLMKEAALLERLTVKADHEDRLRDFDELFGDRERVFQGGNDPNSTIHKSVVVSGAQPERFSEKREPFSSTLLLTMPTVFPNCQVLHFDPVKFHPSRTPLPTTTPRHLYTPKNVMLWSYEPTRKQYLSNSRFIQWSDGTTSLQVGAETYDTHTFTEAGLTFVAEPRGLYRFNAKVPSLVETEPVDNHITLRPRMETSNSVDLANEELAALRRTQDIATRVAVPTSRLPFFTEKGPNEPKTPAEQYAEIEGVRLQKEIARRAKEGNPMSIAEQLSRDKDIMVRVAQALSLGQMDALVQQQKESAEGEKHAARGGTRSTAAGSGRRLYDPSSNQDEVESVDSSSSSGRDRHRHREAGRKSGRDLTAADDNDDEAAPVAQQSLRTEITNPYVAGVLTALGNLARTAAFDAAEVIQNTSKYIQENNVTSPERVKELVEGLKKDTIDDMLDFSAVSSAVEGV